MKIWKLSLIILSTAAIAGCSKVQVSDLPSDSAKGQGIVGGDGGDHSTTGSLKASNGVDLLLVIDDSTSMKPDSLALASKLEGFVKKLESFSLDWQLCMTTTNVAVDDGASLVIDGVTRTENWILKKGDSDISNKVLNTIDNLVFGGSGSGDERGVAAMSRHLSHSSANHCYRPGAALSVIVISDEDERSVGGNQSLDSRQYATIQPVDQPSNYISQVQSTLGVNSTAVALTVHSIIVLPGDNSCLAEQNNQGYPGFVGTFYNNLSSLTGGSVASICSGDFSQGLSVFAEQIQKSLQRVKLDCAPAAGWKVSTSPALPNIQAHPEGNYMVIEGQVAQDTVVNVSYSCQ